MGLTQINHINSLMAKFNRQRNIESLELDKKNT